MEVPDDWDEAAEGMPLSIDSIPPEVLKAYNMAIQVHGMNHGWHIEVKYVPYKENEENLEEFVEQAKKVTSELHPSQGLFSQGDF